MTGLAVGLWTIRLLNINVITAILGATPSGISGMSLLGSEYKLGTAVVILLLVVKYLNLFGLIKS